MRHGLLSLLTALLLCHFVPSARGETLVSGGVARTYLLHLPPGSLKDAPLLLVLHGGGGKPERSARFMEEMTGFDELSDRERFVVAYPTGGVTKKGRLHWNDGRFGPGGLDDLQFLSDLITHLVTTYRLDPARVYLAGISNGAMMSYTYLCRSGSRPLARVAGIASVAGAVNTIVAPSCSIAWPVDLISLHGTNDEFIRTMGGRVKLSSGSVLSQHASVSLVRDRNRCGAAPRAVPAPDRVRSDGITSTVRSEICGEAGTAVTVISMNGGGHTWPGRLQCPGCGRVGGFVFGRLVGRTCMDFDATTTIWQFFSRR